MPSSSYLLYFLESKQERKRDKNRGGPGVPPRDGVVYLDGTPLVQPPNLNHRIFIRALLCRNEPGFSQLAKCASLAVAANPQLPQRGSAQGDELAPAGFLQQVQRHSIGAPVRADFGQAHIPHVRHHGEVSPFHATPCCWVTASVATNLQTRSHISTPRRSAYRSGQRTALSSVPSSKPSSTNLEASAIAERMAAMSASGRSSGAQIRTASWIGAQT